MEKAQVGYVFQFAASLGDGMQVTVNGNLPIDAPVEAFKAEFNKVYAAVDHQRAKHEVKMLTAKLRGDYEELEQLEKTYQRQMSGKMKEDQAATRLAEQIVAVKEKIAEGERELEARKAVAEG